MDYSFPTAGVSAGGIGALFHSIRFAQSFTHATVAVLLDSAWFVNFQNFFALFVGSRSKDLISLFNLNSTTFCDHFDNSQIVPCCAVPSCLLSSLLATKSLRRPSMLIIQSGYDAFPLSKAFEASSYLTTTSLMNYLDGLNGYIRGTLRSFVSSSGENNIALFQANCGKHVYLMGSSLYDTIAESKLSTSSISFFGGTVVYGQNVTDYYWTGVKVKLIGLRGKLLQRTQGQTCLMKRETRSCGQLVNG